MLEKPELEDELLVRNIRESFMVNIREVTFLPLGADINTAVYRGDAADATQFFIKLRRGERSGLSIQISHLLSESGVAQVIPPIPASNGQLWVTIDDFLVTLTPYITGQNGFDCALSDENWATLGRALKTIHSIELPDALRARLPHEDFSDEWRELVRAFQLQANGSEFVDVSAGQMAEIMREKQSIISELLDHAQQLGDELRQREMEFVPCHADIHAGNVLIDEGGKLYVVDWDTFMLAPKERDLMFVGAGIGDSWRGERTERNFYAGYGPTEIDWSIIAYYRCERIIQDIATFGQQLFLSPEGGADRPRAVSFVASNFQPNSTIDIALESVQRALA